jgi:hypothetical protein
MSRGCIIDSQRVKSDEKRGAWSKFGSQLERLRPDRMRAKKVCAARVGRSAVRWQL